MVLSILVLINGFFVARQQKLAEKMIRLHVVAASDQEIDQEIKLLVRDVVLQKTSHLLEGETDPRAALAQGLSLAVVNGKGWILAVILWVLTNKVKKTRGLHPIIFILASAAVGVAFSM